MAARPVPRAALLASVHARLDEGRGVLLVGDIGVGKSYLLGAVGRSRRGDHVETIIGAPATRSLTFGAVSHLLPDRAVADPVRLMQLARRRLEEQAGGRSLTVLVDDLDQLDQATRALVHQLATRRAASVVATVREEHAASEEMLQFWKDDHLARVEVGPLTRDEHEQLVGLLLGSAPSPVLERRIWDLATGNPLFTRELVLSGIAERDTNDFISGSTRLRDVVGRRLRDLSAGQRRIVDAVSLAEPVGAGALTEVFGNDAVASVERAALLSIEPTGGGTWYRISHPLLSELLRSEMPPATRQELARRMAAAVAANPTDEAAELRSATWQLNAGVAVEHGLATRAARAAMRVFDGDAAVRLIEGSTIALGPLEERSADELITWGEACSLVGRVDDAERAFVAAEVEADDETLGTITVLRAINLLHRGGRADEAMQLLHRRARELGDPHARASIESMLMQGEGMQGDFRRALGIGPALAAEVRTGDVAELRVLVGLVVARAVTGHLDHVEAEMERGVAIAGKLADEHPFEADQMLLNRLLVTLARPDLESALRQVDQRLASASGAADGPWYYFLGWILSSAGNLDAARRAAEAGLESLSAVDPIGLRMLAIGVHALTNALAGDTGTARDSISALAADPRRDQPRAQMFAGRANTWLLARTEGVEAAAAHAAGLGDQLRRAWHQTWGAWVASDAIRLGQAEPVLALLADIAQESGDGAVHLFAEHAQALERCDSTTLADLATRYERAGMRAHAAEAYAQATRVGGDPPAAALHRHRAVLLASRCPGFSSPVLDDLSSPLSARELDVAAAAAAGRSSREIADDLFISRRTVDNHLGAVYSKLGLRGRADLTDIFRVTQSTADGYSFAR